MRTERREGFLLELGPNTVRPTPELWALVGELGLRDEALLADPRLPRYVEWNGRLHALPMSPGGLVSTKLLSARGKLRLLAEPFARGGQPDPDESVHAFFARRLGEEVADRFIEPFVGGIFAGSSRSLSVAAAFPSLARWDTGARKHRARRDRGEEEAAAERRSRRGGCCRFARGLETLPRRSRRVWGRLETRVASRACRATTGREGRAPPLRRDGWVATDSRGERSRPTRRSRGAGVGGGAARPGVRSGGGRGARRDPSSVSRGRALEPPACLPAGASPRVRASRRSAGREAGSSARSGARASSRAGARGDRARHRFSGRLARSRGGATVGRGACRESPPGTSPPRSAPASIRASCRSRGTPSIPQYTAGHLARIAVLEKTESALPGPVFPRQLPRRRLRRRRREECIDDLR